MNWWSGRQLSNAAFLWPALVATATAEAMRATAELVALGTEVEPAPAPPEPCGTTASEVVRDLPSVRLRDYGAGLGAVPGRATLICAPLALHGAVVADLAPGHSLVEVLRSAGIGRLFLADWRSASVDMANLRIDDYLATLNVLVDDIGGPVDLIGLCQGGWLALVYAARFPAKVRRLVIAGAPVDPSAQPSDLSQLAVATPSSVFQGFVDAGGGRVLGRTISSFWGADTLDSGDALRALQLAEAGATADFAAAKAAYDAWNEWTIDLPGSFYLEVIEKLYKGNDLAGGRFVALGERIDLSRLRLPIYCLAGADDHVVAPQQVLAVRRLVATPPEQLRSAVAPGGHLSLFMGRETLGREWPEIVRWLKDDGAVDTMSAAAS
ncbi:MAG: alpha/beta fold hydrolase [Xanthobacteraceae bacterium]|nr:alpha/beta fold hydrolase [Xanthobacteraceae bacterium]